MVKRMSLLAGLIALLAAHPTAGCQPIQPLDIRASEGTGPLPAPNASRPAVSPSVTPWPSASAPAPATSAGPAPGASASGPPGVSAPVVRAPAPITAFRGEYDLALQPASAGPQADPVSIHLTLDTAGGAVAGTAAWSADGRRLAAQVSGELVGYALRLRLDHTLSGEPGVLSLAAATHRDGSAFGGVVGEPGRRCRLVPRPGSPRGPLPAPEPLETPFPLPSGVVVPSPDVRAEARLLVSTAWTFATPGDPRPVSPNPCEGGTRHKFVDPTGDGRDLELWIDDFAADGRTILKGSHAVLVGRPGAQGFHFDGARYSDHPPTADGGPVEGTMSFRRLRLNAATGAFEGLRGMGHPDGVDYRGPLPVGLAPLNEKASTCDNPVGWAGSAISVDSQGRCRFLLWSSTQAAVQA